MISNLFKKFVGYFFTGGLSATVDAGCFALLLAAHMPTAPAAATSFSWAALLNFQLTSRLVFRQNPTKGRFALFFFTALVGCMVNVGITLTGTALLGLPPLAAKTIGIASAFPLNFALNLGIVFNK